MSENTKYLTALFAIAFSVVGLVTYHFGGVAKSEVILVNMLFAPMTIVVCSFLGALLMASALKESSDKQNELEK